MPRPPSTPSRAKSPKKIWVRTTENLFADSYENASREETCEGRQEPKVQTESEGEATQLGKDEAEAEGEETAEGEDAAEVDEKEIAEVD
jgi:hypothetical protein